MQSLPLQLHPAGGRIREQVDEYIVPLLFDPGAFRKVENIIMLSADMQPSPLVTSTQIVLESKPIRWFNGYRWTG